VRLLSARNDPGGVRRTTNHRHERLSHEGHQRPTEAAEDRRRQELLPSKRPGSRYPNPWRAARPHGGAGIGGGPGGVGIYPSFVHLDAGPQRFWKG
jgi:hypothetical protein